MATAHSQHRAGTALVVAAAVAWSTAPFFTRLLPFDSWTILFWRGLFGGVLIAAILVLMQGRAGLRDLTGVGRNGWLVASLSTLGMVCFIPAATLPREAYDLDPVRILAHRIFPQLGELARRLVDRVGRQAIGQLADDEQIVAGRVDIEGTRLLFGRIGIDRCQ
jgi:hypothetical protein